MGMGGNWSTGKNWNGIYVSDVNGKGMGTGIKSLTWEEFGTKNLFPHISTSKHYIVAKLPSIVTSDLTYGAI